MGQKVVIYIYTIYCILQLKNLHKEIIDVREELRFLKCIDHEVPIEIDIPDSGDKFPAMLLVHGFMSSRNNDNHMLARISKKIVEAGIVAARIDLCSMGENLYSRENYVMKVMKKKSRPALAIYKTYRMLQKIMLAC